LISTLDEIKGVAQMADPVRARRLSDHEGQTLTQIVRRGRGNPIRVRRATIIMASSSGTPVAAIARLVAADEDTVRDVIRTFNERGLAALDPQWAGGRPRHISDDDSTFTMGASDHPNHPALARRMQAYLRWRNTHARHPDVLAAQRRERARIRSERHQRWGRPRAA
jgi:hypothetical protein